MHTFLFDFDFGIYPFFKELLTMSNKTQEQNPKFL
jgi:hypothetical protein